jgi:CHASE3 domain sensor protein
MDRKTEISGVYQTPEGFLINKDNGALAAYKNRRQNVKQMQEDIQSLKDDLQEIKDILKGLARK